MRGLLGQLSGRRLRPPGDPHPGVRRRLLGELVLAPAGEEGAFVPAYVDSEKKNLVDKIRAQLNDKLQYALSRLRGQMCAGEAYGLDKLGTEAAAQAITGQALYARYREMVEQAPVYLYYCGSADPPGWRMPSARLLPPCPRQTAAPSPGPRWWRPPRVLSAASRTPWTWARES